MSCTTIFPPIVPTVELMATGFCIDGSARLNLSPAFVKVDFALSTKSPRVNDGKYDDISEIFSLYQKIRYTIKNGSDLYIVFNYNQLRVDENWDRRSFVNYSRDNSIKINYAYRF